jgi:preprotein translocase subunit SecE
MSTQDLNREQKRQLRKMGALDEQGNPARASRPQAKSGKPDEDKVGPAQYLQEVRAEMRKVAWPGWEEVRKYSIVVLVTVVLFTLYVGGLDTAFGFFQGWLYRN